MAIQVRLKETPNMTNWGRSWYWTVRINRMGMLSLMRFMGHRIPDHENKYANYAIKGVSAAGAVYAVYKAKQKNFKPVTFRFEGVAPQTANLDSGGFASESFQCVSAEGIKRPGPIGLLREHNTISGREHLRGRVYAAQDYAESAAAQAGVESTLFHEQDELKGQLKEIVESAEYQRFVDVWHGDMSLEDAISEEQREAFVRAARGGDEELWNSLLESDVFDDESRQYLNRHKGGRLVLALILMAKAHADVTDMSVGATVNPAFLD